VALFKDLSTDAGRFPTFLCVVFFNSSHPHRGFSCPLLEIFETGNDAQLNDVTIDTERVIFIFTLSTSFLVG